MKTFDGYTFVDGMSLFTIDEHNNIREHKCCIQEGISFQHGDRYYDIATAFVEEQKILKYRQLDRQVAESKRKLKDFLDNMRNLRNAIS